MSVDYGFLMQFVRIRPSSGRARWTGKTALCMQTAQAVHVVKKSALWGERHLGHQSHGDRQLRILRNDCGKCIPSPSPMIESGDGARCTHNVYQVLAVSKYSNWFVSLDRRSDDIIYLLPCVFVILGCSQWRCNAAGRCSLVHPVVVFELKFY